MQIKHTVLCAYSFFLLLSCTNKMSKIIDYAEQQGIRQPATDSFEDNICSRYPLVAGYKIANTSKQRSLNFFIAISQNKGMAYRYTEAANIFSGSNNKSDPKRNTVDSFGLTRTAMDSIINVLYREKVWEFKYNDVNSDESPCDHIKPVPRCGISDGPVFYLLTVGKGKKITCGFYAPAFFEKQCCPGNKDRQKFLKIQSVIDQVFLEK